MGDSYHVPQGSDYHCQQRDMITDREHPEPKVLPQVHVHLFDMELISTAIVILRLDGVHTRKVLVLKMFEALQNDMQNTVRECTSLQ